MHLVALLVAAALAVVVLGESPWDCDPLVPEVCGLPFPSNFYRDSTTGLLNMTSATFPTDRFNKTINVGAGGWNNLDGFSPLPFISAYFTDVSIDNCPHFWNISRSLDPDSPTFLVRASTGELIPHFVELDHSSDEDVPKGQYKRLMMIWPAVRLEDSERYVVGIRNLMTNLGSTITPSTAFRALRDRVSSSDPTVNARRNTYESDIFPHLAAAGCPRSQLLLAWDFTVMSTNTITGRMLSMRDDAFSRVGDQIPFRFLDVKEKPQAGVARTLFGVMTVPWYLNMLAPSKDVRINADPNDPNTALYKMEGEITFTVVIPQSLVDNGTIGGILQYGHGLFGSQGEVTTSYLVDEANRYGYILICTNWLGLSYEDEGVAAIVVTEDLTDFAAIPDRSHQGMLNALLLMKLAMSPSFVNHKDLVFNGKTVVDPTRRWYNGNSQGGILGSVYMALSTDVTRGVIGVGGGPYSMLLPRSHDFTALFNILKLRYEDPRDRIQLLALMQLLWDRMEPSGYLYHVTRDLLPDTPMHTVVFHYGLGDAQVSWLGAEFLARTVGSYMFESNVQEGNETFFGYKMISDTTELSTPGMNLIQGFNFGAPTAPFVNIPANSTTDAHEKPRRTLAAQTQMHRFFTEGVIYNACGGPCYFPDGPSD